MQLKQSFIALMLCTLPAWPESPSLVLTWEQAVARAAQHHPDLLAALRAKDASQFTYQKSWNGVAPSLSLSHGYSDSKGSRTGSWDTQASVNWTLLDVGQWANIQASSARRKRAQADLLTESSTILRSLANSFSGLLFAQEQLSVTQRLQEIWKTNSEMIALRYDSGRESKGNKMKTEAEYLRAQADVSQAKRDLRVSQQALSETLGEPTRQPWIASGTWATSTPPADIPDLDDMIEQLPVYQSQKAFLDESRAALRSARSAWWPSLSVSYNRSWQGTSEFPDQPHWSTGGRLQYALFSGGPTAALNAISSAEATLQQNELLTTSLRNQLRTQLETAWSNFLQAEETTTVQSAFLEAARQRRKESDIRYQNGLMPFEQWQLVVIELANAEKNYLRTQQNQLLAQADWYYAIGKQLPPVATNRGDAQ